VHAENAPPSIRHSKDTPGSVSVNLKVALPEVLELGGPAVIVGGGGPVRSKVTDTLGLSAPLQLLWTGVTEYSQVPSGTDVSLHVVPDTIAEQVPDAIVCSAVPVEA
jgi:hypothetical protein